MPFSSNYRFVDRALHYFAFGAPFVQKVLCEFETLTYRDMPFILAPLLWDKISRPLRKAGEKVERAHGDGMMVSFDSPEAFEEVVWLA